MAQSALHEEKWEFNSQDIFLKKSGRAVHTCNISAGEIEMGGSLGLPNQPVQAPW